MNGEFEPTWEEVAKLVGFLPEKDTSFSEHDIIRLVENNLTAFEKLRVIEYFCEHYCQEEDWDPDDIPMEEVPQVPGPNILPLLPPVVIPQLQPPPFPKLPPPPKSLPWIGPVFPFIIIPALPYDILQYLKKVFGGAEAHAAEISAKDKTISELITRISYLENLVRYYVKKEGVTKSPIRVPSGQKTPVTEPFPEIIPDVDEKISDETIPGIEPIEIDESTLPIQDEEIIIETPEIPISDDDEDLNGYTENDVNKAIDKLEDYYYPDLIFKYWFISWDIKYYVFDWDGENIEWTGYQLISMANALPW